MSSKLKCVSLSVAALLTLIPTMAARGAIITTPKNIVLQANAVEWVPFRVSGSETLYAMDFYAEVLDAAGGIQGPQMESIDLLNNTIFTANNTGQQTDLIASPGSTPWLAGYGVEVDGNNSASVVADGVFAWIKFNTKDLFSGTWDFRLIDVGATDPGTGLDTNMVDDSFNSVLIESVGFKLTVVPEPSSLLLALSGLGLASAVYAARRRARRSHSQTV